MRGSGECDHSVVRRASGYSEFSEARRQQSRRCRIEHQRFVEHLLIEELGNEGWTSAMWLG